MLCALPIGRPYTTCLNESLADLRKVNAVVHMLHFSTQRPAGLDDRETTDGRASARYQGFGIVQRRATVEAHAEEERIGIEVVELFEWSSATLAELH